MKEQSREFEGERRTSSRRDEREREGETRENETKSLKKFRGELFSRKKFIVYYR